MWPYSYAKTNQWEVACSFVYSTYWFPLRMCVLYENHKETFSVHINAVGVRTHQISVQALIPLFVRFCVVTFGKLFCSEWIKNAKCVSVCLCRVSIPLLINHISDFSFDLFLSPVVLVLLFFLNTLICWHSVPLIFSFLTEYCRRAGLPTLNPRQN